MPTFLLAGLTLALGWAVLRQGGVWPQDWRWTAAACGALAVVYYAATPRKKLAPAGRLMPWLLGGLLALCVFQMVPLPLGWVRALSPERAAAVARGAEVLGASSRAALSAAPQPTKENTLSLGVYVAAFLLARELAARRRGRPWVAVAPLIAIGTLEAALGLAQWYTARMAGAAPLAVGTYNSRNHYAGLLEMTLPLALLAAFAVYRKRGPRGERPLGPALAACGLLLAAAMMLVATVASLSRMGFMATLAALFLTGSIAFASSDDERRRPVRKWAVTAAAGTLAVAAFVFLPTDELIGRFAEIASTEEIERDTRAEIWRNTWELVKAYPAVGCGFGAYQSCLMKYKTAAPMYTVDYAHNDYLQVLAELGVTGFALGAGVLAIVLWRVGRVVNRERGAPEWHVALGCLGALAAMLLHSLVDFNMYIPANAMTLAWIAGVGESLGRNQTGWHQVQ